MRAVTHAPSTAGGSAAAGGIAFHVNVGAIACVYALRGTPVQWTDSWTDAAPRSVSFETSGPGDDLSLGLTDGSIVEIQVKKGLRADLRFWSALDALCEGIRHDRCSYGILIVCPHSSIPVRRGYARALERIGVGRNDGASPEQIRLANRLAEKGLAAESVCKRIRIKTVTALEDSGDAIAGARAELRHVCADDRHVPLAWDVLCQDVLARIASKSRRTVNGLLARLQASGIDIENAIKDSPIAVSDGLLRWTLSRTEHFEVLGIPRSLPTDEAWLELTAFVQDESTEQALSVEQALADYHSLGKEERTDSGAIDARTIGTFRTLCVVIGGPGSGKSLLLRVLAREFAKDSRVSIRVQLRALATRMQQTGCGVEEGLMQLGVDGSGVSWEQLRAACLSDLVLLCDGLDECGERQSDIAAGLKDISVSHPSYRIVVTTRPIGYRTAELRDWRHYEIAPLAQADTAKHLEALSGCAGDEDDGEGTDVLASRIAAHLEEGGVSQVLGRSPLLLALGAALFLRWGDPSKTKLELYERIFHLIDDAPAARRAGCEPPAKAIRCSVLNELGWLIAASPLRAAEELERQCARTMQQALGVTLLQAQAEVEASVRYWEEKGLIERLRHPGIDLIAFIHKTFGEFAAARYLSEMDLEGAAEAIRTAPSIPDWAEILDFANGTRFATTVARLLLSEFGASPDLDESTLRRVLGVLVHPEVSLPLVERTAFLQHVFALACSADRREAYRVGLCLTEHDLSRLPETEQMAWALAEAPAEWSRLVGWAVIACHFPDRVSRNALEEALFHFMDRGGAEESSVPRVSVLFGRETGNWRVFENFVLGALRSLLSSREVEYQDRLISETERKLHDSGITIGFAIEFKALLKELGRADSLKLWSGPVISAGYLDKLDAGFEALLTKVVSSAFLADDCSQTPRTGLKGLAAFYESAGLADTPISDIYIWLSDDIRLDAVHALLRAAAYVYDLPVERLAAEAREAVAIGNSFRRDRRTTSKNSERKLNLLADVLPNVDVAKVDWRRAEECNIDLELVEGLIFHPSRWVQRLAARFLDARLDGPARRSACERLLEAGTGDALHWAAALTSELSDGCDLLIDRIGGSDTGGLHHLFDKLTNRRCAMTRSHFSVIEKGLINLGARTAVSAARWCQHCASSTDAWLVELLRLATSYWRENEEPYPENGGVVPHSPREALLRTLCGIAPPSFEELVELIRDPRSDVRDAAMDMLIGRAESSGQDRSTTVNSIVGKRFSAKHAEKLLKASVPYNAAQLSILCELCKDRDPEYRLVAARRVLTHPRMNREKALATAESMKGDDDGDIRDAIYQFLDA